MASDDGKARLKSGEELSTIYVLNREVRLLSEQYCLA